MVILTILLVTRALYAIRVPIDLSPPILLLVTSAHKVHIVLQVVVSTVLLEQSVSSRVLTILVLA